MSEIAKKTAGLVLVGYRGTGKSTVGRIVAERLSRPFIDADAALEAIEGKPVRTIFADHGEPHFRDCEERVLSELTSIPGRVIATGGGAILRESNRLTLMRYGLVVWLSASVDELQRRLATDSATVPGRPPLTALGTLVEIAGVLESRIPLYKAGSNVEISTDGRSPVDVADALLAWLPSAMFELRGVSS